MGATEAVHAAYVAKIAGDSGSTGLNNSTSPANLTYVYRMGDARRTLNWPNLGMQHQSAPSHPMSTRKVVAVTTRHVIETNRDGPTNFLKLNAIESRFDAAILRQALAQQSVDGVVWNFSPPEILGAMQQVPGGKTNQFMIVTRVIATGV